MQIDHWFTVLFNGLICTRKLDGTNSDITTKTFDAVMICIGHYWDQVRPDIPGMEKFEGSIVHSGDYRTFHPYVGKRVVIVGSSHSASMYSYYILPCILNQKIQYCKKNIT